MKKSVLCISLIVLSLFASIDLVKAKDNKDGYIYSYWGEPIPSALGFSHTQTYDKFDLNVNLFTPEDIFAYEEIENEEKIYIVDSALNTLIVLDKNYQKLAEIEIFLDINDTRTTCVLADDVTEKTPEVDKCKPEDVINKPSGVAVTKDAIYIADTEGNRIIKLNHDYKRVESFGTPNDKTFDNTEYNPLKIAVDKTGRIYVIAKNVYEGIIELNIDGTFNRFTGVNQVSVSVFEAIQRRFASEAQLSQMSLFLPTSFTNMIIDNQGFIYSTAGASSTGDNTNMIKAINPKGIDVLKKNGYDVPKGDLMFAMVQGEVITGPSQLVDIALNEFGMYTVLDQLRGRLFTYDNEGRLLYISADKGLQEGKLSTPVALTYFGNQMVVLDQKNQSLEVYSSTEFGDLVNKAVAFHYKGDFDNASKTWEEVAKLNTNYEIAYVGIGKSLLRQQKYKEAMENFKIGQDKVYYAKAFEGYRKEIFNNNFGYIMTGASLLILFILRKPIVDFFKGEKGDRE
jgi:hypothetical protein